MVGMVNGNMADDMPSGCSGCMQLSLHLPQLLSHDVVLRRLRWLRRGQCTR